MKSGGLRDEGYSNKRLEKTRGKNKMSPWPPCEEG